jgi:hypothetical protein
MGSGQMGSKSRGVEKSIGPKPESWKLKVVLGEQTQNVYENKG